MSMRMEYMQGGKRMNQNKKFMKAVVPRIRFNDPNEQKVLEGIGKNITGYLDQLYAMAKDIEPEQLPEFKIAVEQFNHILAAGMSLKQAEIARLIRAQITLGDRKEEADGEA